MLPLPSNAVVGLELPSTLALNCVPNSIKPALVLAVNEPAPENCTNTISVVPTVTGAFVVHTHPVSALVVPYSTNTNAPGISPLGDALSKSVVLVSTYAAPPEPASVTTYIPL